MTLRRLPRTVATALVGLLALAACDSGPQGPGSLTAVAAAPSLGGVVLEVEGSGIQGFAGRGSTRVYSAAVEGRTGVYRIILIDPEPGELAFDLEVDDVGMEGPIVKVISATDGENHFMPASRVTVRVER